MKLTKYKGLGWMPGLLSNRTSPFFACRGDRWVIDGVGNKTEEATAQSNVETTNRRLAMRSFLAATFAVLALLCFLCEAFVERQNVPSSYANRWSEASSPSNIDNHNHHNLLWVTPPPQPAVGTGGFRQQEQVLVRRPTLSLQRTRFRGGSSVLSPPEQPLGTEGFHHRRQIPRLSILDDILKYTNVERRSHGLAELAYNPKLAKAAQHHAECMASNRYFSHTGFDGSDPAERVKFLTDYRYQRVGENLFWRTPDNNPRAAVAGWMQSPGHRRNVLNPEFIEIGLGYATEGYNHFYVQVFGRPVGNPTIQGNGDARSTLFRLTNQVRCNAQLPLLKPSDVLHHAAQKQADDILRGQSTLGANIRAENYGYSLVAATLAHLEPFNDPQRLIESWLEQRPVYMLEEQYTEMGIGYTTDGDSHYYVQLLGAPAPDKSARWHLSHCWSSQGRYHHQYLDNVWNGKWRHGLSPPPPSPQHPRRLGNVHQQLSVEC